MKKVKQCTKCGKKYSKKEKFCISCGGELVEVNNEMSIKDENEVMTPSKKIFKGIITVFIAIIIGLIIGIGVLVALNAYQNRPVKYQDSMLIQRTEDETLIIGYGKSYNFDGYISYYRFNADKTSIALTDENNTLYLINENGCYTISDNVDDFKISSNGNAIAFITSSIEDTLELNENNVKYKHGELHSYNADTQTNSLINSDVTYYLYCKDYGYSISTYSTTHDSIAISENGNSIGYISNIEFDTENDKISWQSYININGVENTFEKNILFCAINDDTSCVYWNNLDKSNLYCGNIITNETNKLTYNSNNSFMGLAFNKNYTECLVFYNDKTYISKNCDDPELVSDFCVNSIHNSSIYNNTSVTYDNIITLDIDTFSKNIFENDNTFYYLQKEKEGWVCEKINSNSTFVYTSLNSNYLYTIRNSNDTLVKSSTNSTEKEIIEIGKNVASAVVSTNEKYVYYIDKNTSDLYCFDGKTSTKIDYDVARLFEYNNMFYYIKDTDIYGFGTLYCSSNGNDGIKVEHGIDVYDVEISKDGVFFVSINDIDENMGTLYQINDKTKTTLVEDNVYYYY